MTTTQTTQPDLTRIARAQKHILWMILANILFAALELLIPGALFLGGCVQVFFVYRLARALNRSGIVWGALMLIPTPLLSLVALVILNGDATRTLQHHGVKVGLMGAKGPIPQHTQNVSDVFR